MFHNENYIKGILRNLQIDVIVAKFTHCWRDWGAENYITDFNAFYFIIDGEGKLNISGTDYDPKPLQMCLIPQGKVHTFGTISENTYKKYWCTFTAKIGNKNLFDLLKINLLINVNEPEWLQTIFTNLVNYSKNDDAFSLLRVKAAILEILAYFMDNNVIEELNIYGSSNFKKFDKLMYFLDNHYIEDINIKMLAEMMNYHPNYFIKYFKLNIGYSPIHYINILRINKAKSLLLTTNMNVSEVSEAVGFPDVFFFSKQFKKYTGFPPSKYKKYN